MNILEILQTIGICVGALALAVIAFMVFMVASPFIPSSPSADQDDDEDDPLLWMPVNLPSQRRRRQRRPKSNDTPN